MMDILIPLSTKHPKNIQYATWSLFTQQHCLHTSTSPSYPTQVSYWSTNLNTLFHDLVFFLFCDRQLTIRNGKLSTSVLTPSQTERFVSQLTGQRVSHQIAFSPVHIHNQIASIIHTKKQPQHSSPSGTHQITPKIIRFNVRRFNSTETTGSLFEKVKVWIQVYQTRTKGITS